MNIEYLANHFLIAMPSLTDPNFSRTVSYVCEHNDDGAIAIIINRPTEYTLSYIFEQMSIEVTHPTANDIPVMYGGPVQQDRGFVIHRPHGKWRSSLKVTEDIAVTTSHDILEAVAQGKGPDDIIIALGYAGWGEAQLEAELMSNHWLNCEANSDILFATPFQDRWRAAAETLGVNITTISDQSGHA